MKNGDLALVNTSGGKKIGPRPNSPANFSLARPEDIAHLSALRPPKDMYIEISWHFSSGGSHRIIELDYDRSSRELNERGL
jgi:hypothetical protein